MKTSKIMTHMYVGISFFGLLAVSVMSIVDPQSTMDLVQVKLGNNDAISSIRGIYGGVGLAILISLVYAYFKLELQVVLSFLTLFWGFYTLSRLLTMVVNGPLGDFGQQWLITEGILFIIGLLLLSIIRQGKNAEKTAA